MPTGNGRNAGANIEREVKYIFFLLLGSLTAGSCRRDDTTVGNDFGGLYKVTDLVADRPLDLNDDGTSSLDLYAEISEPFRPFQEGSVPFLRYDFDQPGNYAEVRPAFADQPGRRLILPRLPWQDIYYIEQTEPRLAFYGHDPSCYEYTLTRGPRVDVRLVDPGAVRLGTIARLERTGKDTFEIGMTAHLFDFATLRWTDVALTATYRRVQPTDR